MFRKRYLVIIGITICGLFYSAVINAQDEGNIRIAVLDLEAIGISETGAKALSEMFRSSISQLIFAENEKISENYELLERSQRKKSSMSLIYSQKYVPMSHVLLNLGKH